MKNLIIFLFVYSFTNAQLIQIGQDINGTAQDQKGYDVSINYSGDIVAISSPMNSSVSSFCGKVEIYKFVNGDWQQLGQTLYGENNLNQDHFGSSITINSAGDRIAISSLNAANDYVKVFFYDGSIWQQLGQTITLSDAFNNDFGYSIDFDEAGQSIVIGAPAYSASITSLSLGKINVYKFDATNGWVQKGSSIVGSTFSDKLGTSVSIDPTGTIIAAGSTGFNSNTGQVKVYSWNGADWQQFGNDINGNQMNDNFGSSLDLSNDGQYLVVGSSGFNMNMGQVKVYSLNGGLWQQFGQTIQGNSEKLGGYKGVSISNDGQYLVVAGKNNSEVGIQTGKFRFLTNTLTYWSELGAIYGESAYDEMGQIQISSNGQRIIAGSRYNSDGGLSAGSARIYDIGNLGLTPYYQDELIIYPNPSNGEINILSNINNLYDNFKVYNLEGLEVEYDYGVTILESGVYYVKFIKNSKFILTQKLIVVK